MTCHATREGVDLESVLKALAEREVNEVHVECGATLAGSFITAGLADELVLYVAPKLMGDAARGLLHLPEIENMAESIQVVIRDLRLVGDDMRIIAGFK